MLSCRFYLPSIHKFPYGFPYELVCSSNLLSVKPYEFRKFIKLEDELFVFLSFVCRCTLKKPLCYKDLTFFLYGSSCDSLGLFYDYVNLHSTIFLGDGICFLKPNLVFEYTNVLSEYLCGMSVSTWAFDDAYLRFFSDYIEHCWSLNNFL